MVPLSVNAGEDSPAEFFIAPLTDISLYTRSGAALGAGLAMGYGRGGAFGIQILYSNDTKELTTLEISSLMRLYVPSLSINSGLFVQINAGVNLFFWDNKKASIFIGGLTLGWRFLLGRHWFVEPALRLGYPYIVAAGLGAGLRL
jgi:hypothetical protein